MMIFLLHDDNKYLFSHTLLCNISLFFVLKELRPFKQQKSPLFLDVIPLNNADIFFTAR